jgi:hypothetical protein
MTVTSVFIIILKHTMMLNEKDYDIVDNTDSQRKLVLDEAVDFRSF